MPKCIVALLKDDDQAPGASHVDEIRLGWEMPITAAAQQRVLPMQIGNGSNECQRQAMHISTVSPVNYDEICGRDRDSGSFEQTNH